MSLYDIIPVENEGMSVITLIVFAFGGIGIITVMKWINIRFKEQDMKLKEHDDCVDELRAGLSDGRVQFARLEGTIKNTENIVYRIEQVLSDFTKK